MSLHNTKSNECNSLNSWQHLIESSIGKVNASSLVPTRRRHRRNGLLQIHHRDLELHGVDASARASQSSLFVCPDPPAQPATRTPHVAQSSRSTQRKNLWNCSMELSEHRRRQRREEIKPQTYDIQSRRYQCGANSRQFVLSKLNTIMSSKPRPHSSPHTTKPISSSHLPHSHDSRSSSSSEPSERAIDSLMALPLSTRKMPLSTLSEAAQFAADMYRSMKKQHYLQCIYDTNDSSVDAGHTLIKRSLTMSQKTHPLLNFDIALL